MERGGLTKECHESTDAYPAIPLFGNANPIDSTYLVPSVISDTPCSAISDLKKFNRLVFIMGRSQ